VLCSLLELGQKIVQLPPFAPGAYPLSLREFEPFVGLLRVCATPETRDPHDIPDPSEFGILRLQVVVVTEASHAVADDARRCPVELYAQSFRQAPVIEVLSLPGTFLGHVLNRGGNGEQKEKHGHQVRLRPEVGVQDEQEAHQECEDVRDAKYQQRSPLVPNCEPVGRPEQAIDRLCAVRQDIPGSFVEKRPSLGFDPIGKPLRVTAELTAASTDPAVLFR
jgi:hypothetical protein